MVAPGMVKSRMPSAFADSVHRSAESLTPFSGRPASTPASLQQFRARRFQRAGQHRARRFRNDAHQRAAHPAAGPRNDQSHIGHGFTSERGIAGAGDYGNFNRGRRSSQPLGLQAVIALDDDEIGDECGCRT